MAELFLDSLEIKNFHAFEHLTIEKLGRVNLILGRNSVGKTSLLEAIWLYANKGSVPTIVDILQSRDEFTAATQQFLAENNFSMPYLPFLMKLFYFDNNSGNRLIRAFIKPLTTAEKSLSLFITAGYFVDGENGERKIQLLSEDNSASPEFTATLSGLAASGRLLTVFVVVFDNQPFYYPLAKTFADEIANIANLQPAFVHFIRNISFSSQNLIDLWNRIALTGKQEIVIKALQIINPQLNGVAIVEENGKQVLYINITNIKRRATPASFGEGLQRIFNIVLALVNSENGVLLIDDVERSLHWRTQADLWRVIFKLAKELNVQVFATTHSWETIQAFQEIAEENQNEEALVFRLEAEREGQVKAITIDEETLKMVVESNIEIR